MNRLVKNFPLWKSEEYRDFFAYPRQTICQALHKLKDSGKKVLLIVDSEGKLKGTLTDGDIRRAMLEGKTLRNQIGPIFNRNPKVFSQEDFSLERARKVFLESLIDLIPILNSVGQVAEFITWSEAFRDEKRKPEPLPSMTVPVVIMAGGKGTRLDPFTRIFPKPLIPLGDKPVIELIVEEFFKFGVQDFILSLNFKGEMVKSYFASGERPYSLSYLWEKGFLGTAGSLRLLKGKLLQTFFVSNCDVLVKADMVGVLRFHREAGAALTTIAVEQSMLVPYGVLDFDKKGVVSSFEEKPALQLKINSGVYVFEPKVLDYLPKKGPAMMSDLICALLKNKQKVAAYSIPENLFIDIGQWEEFRQASKKLELGII